MEPEKELQMPRKKEQIISTAEELFQKFGFKRVTVEEICLKASVSKMTFYKYFDNKEELIKNMMTNWLNQTIDLVIQIKDLNIPFMEKIEMLLKLKQEGTAKFSKEMLFDYINPEPEMQIFMNDFYIRGKELFVKFIREAQLKGDVRQEIKPEFLIAVLDKFIELARDPELLSLYPNVTDFSLEINKFVYCGILPIDTPEINVAQNN